MGNPTTNFGWQMPTATDLVTDLPADFEVFGQAVDTDFVDLLGGTTGQVLSKTSATDMAFTWIDQDDSNAIQNAIVDAKGDLIGATAADTPSRLAVGTDGQILTADSTEATGLKWITQATSSSGLTLISRTTWSAAASHTVDSVFTSTYENYLIVIDSWVGNSYNIVPQLQLRYGASTSGSVIYGSSFGCPYTGSPMLFQTTTAAAAFDFWRYIGDGTGSFIHANIERVGSGSAQKAHVTGIGMSDAGSEQYKFGAVWTDSQAYTGFVLKTSSGTSTGTVSVYGYAKA
jgi:hypothetical protein